MSAQNPNKPNQKGFTLIELLVVIIVISALTGIMATVINAPKLRSKARDSQRMTDLSQIQTALELYFADYNYYPTTGWKIVNKDDGTGFLDGELQPEYINKVPIDPTYDSATTNSGPCSNIAGQRYNYVSHDGTYYVLTAIMEVADSSDESPCAALVNWSLPQVGGSCSTFQTVDYCYGVESP